MAEGLEPRAVPGSSLLEVLLGVPLIAPLFDSFSAANSRGNTDELPGRPLRGEDHVTEFRYDAMAADVAAREMRSLLQIASAEKANPAPAMENGKAPAAEVADTLMSAPTDLTANRLSADPEWFDALLALAIHRPTSAARVNSEPSSGGGNAAASAAAAPASSAMPQQPVPINDKASILPDAKGNVTAPPAGFGGGSSSHASSGSLKVDHRAGPTTASKGAPVGGAIPIEGDRGVGIRPLDYEPYTQPTAEDDDFYAYHDSTIAISAPGVLWNDSFEYTTTVSLVSGPSHAVAFEFNSDGSFSYTPAWHFVGTDTFVYQLTSGPYSDTATVFLGVANDAPIAVDDAGVYLTKHDTFISVEAPGVTSNDYDPNSDPFQAILVTPPAHAAPDGFHFYADGSFDYMPAYHFVGDDTFTYKLNDGLVDGNVATVTIGVFNIEPVAENDTYSVKHDALLEVSAPGVKDNDYDSDGDPVSAVLVTEPSHAAPNGFHFNADGSFDYMPDTQYVGNDSFTYKVNDGIADSGTTTVTIGVWNNAPVAIDDSRETKHDTQLIVSPPGVRTNDYDPDGDPTAANLVTGPSHAASFTFDSFGSFHYTPAYHYVGTDSFTYKINDGIADSNTATVTLNVFNNPPVAQNDGGYIAAAGVPLNVTPASGVLANDSDPDGDSPLAAGLLSNPSHGEIHLWNDGSFMYTPSPGYAGTDSFTYDARDTVYANSAPATVTITVFRVDTLTVATSPADRTRTKLGVGERVTMTVVPATVPAATWYNTGGTVNPVSGLETTFTAGDRVSTPTVTATIAGQSYAVNFNVIEPSVVTIEPEAGTGVWHLQGVASVGFIGRPYILPDDVSFQFIEVREGTAAAVGLGYFSFQNGMMHAAGNWVQVLPPVPGHGSKVDGTDQISSGPHPQTPYELGSFSWTIPWLFRVGTGAEKQFAYANHLATINAAGDMTITKGGTSKSAALNDPTSSY